MEATNTACVFVYSPANELQFGFVSFHLTAAYVKVAFYKLQLQHIRYDSNEL